MEGVNGGLDLMGSSSVSEELEEDETPKKRKTDMEDETPKKKRKYVVDDKARIRDDYKENTKLLLLELGQINKTLVVISESLKEIGSELKTANAQCNQ